MYVCLPWVSKLEFHALSLVPCSQMSSEQLAAAPEKKIKRTRKAKDPQPKAVHEAILKNLEEPAATNIKNKEDTNDDLFEELFGPGPSEEPELDLEAQLELDLSEL